MNSLGLLINMSYVMLIKLILIEDRQPCKVYHIFPKDRGKNKTLKLKLCILFPLTAIRFITIILTICLS